MDKAVKEGFITFSFIVLTALVLFLVGTYFIVNFVASKKNNECIQQPIAYGVKQLEKTYGHQFTALGSFNVENSPTIKINSTGTYRE